MQPDEQIWCGDPHGPRAWALPHETEDLTVQLDIFGAEHAPEPDPPAYCRPVGKTEQRRLFEPQLAGQLDLNPEDAPEGAER